MTKPKLWLLLTCRALATAALAVGVVGSASAEGYDLKKIMPSGGGGGGTDPAKRRIVESRGASICLDVSGGPNNQVWFTLWQDIPEPNARLASINFDTGKHADLFTGVKVVSQSLGLKSTTARVSNVRYRVELPYQYYGGGRRPTGGLAPGNFIVMSVDLGPGMTFASVIGALNEGLNPATGASGLHFWVTGHYFLGGPPPGVATISDDASFTISGASSRCVRR